MKKTIAFVAAMMVMPFAMASPGAQQTIETKYELIKVTADRAAADTLAAMPELALEPFVCDLTLNDWTGEEELSCKHVDT